MPNGKPGDHPFTDILHYGRSEFGEPVDSLVKELSQHPLFFQVRDEVANLLWETSPFAREGEREGLINEAKDRLMRIRDHLKLAEGKC